MIVKSAKIKSLDFFLEPIIFVPVERPLLLSQFAEKDLEQKNN